MTEAPATNSKSKPRSGRKAAVGRLFVLELSGDRIHSMNPDGSDRKIIVTDCHLPDGIVGRCRRPAISTGPTWASPTSNDGSIERADLDGKNRKVIVPQGVTYTPKQIQLDKKNGKLYWCDREGHARDARESRRLARSKRSSRPAVATRIGAIRPGGALESPSIPSAGQIYWTQKGPDNGEQGRIFRANIEIPKGESAAEPLRHRGVLRPACRSRSISSSI